MWSITNTSLAQFLKGDEFVADKDELTRQNRIAVRYFATAGVPVAIANMFAQSIIRGAPDLSLQNHWLIIYFVGLFVLERILIPKQCKHATLLVYLCQAPVFLVSILLGTVWDPAHQAITFLLFLATIPVLILDRPLRLMLCTLGWCVLFMGLCYAVKDPTTWRPDLIHVIEFYLLSMAMVYVVLVLRLRVLRSLKRTRYHLEHDVTTDAQNQRGLAMHVDRYLNRELFITVGDIDHFTLLSDFYGRDASDGLLHTFANTLKELFGVEHTYRYGGDEMLSILVGQPAGGERRGEERRGGDSRGASLRGEELLDDGLKRVTTCQTSMADARSAEMYSSVSCSFGYVIGTPREGKELNQMIQLAEIYAHKTHRKGEGQVLGGTFDAEALRTGIAEATIATHARAYEINQLTGLPSMAYFITRSDELLHYVADPTRTPVVVFLNVVKFQAYNDEYGYAEGDKLIATLAALLREALPQRHVTYISGSQFGVLCYEDEVDALLADLNAGLQEFEPSRNIQIKAGFAAYTGGEPVISLLDKAKLAHDSIAGLRNTTSRCYDAALDEEIRFKQYLITRLDEAIDKGWIKVYYQPIVHAASGEICNMEALSRWDDPAYGFLPPGKFISILEHERLVYKLTLFVVKQVLRDFRTLEERGIPLVPASVNLSRHDFFECDIVEEICKLVDESGYPHRMLNIEITESAFAEEQSRIKSEVDRFRARGFNVWMDDFGSEYSTLNLLENLNFDVIKLDMQFMRNFNGEGRNAIILADIIGMCRRLGVTTLVEGVETEEQYEILRQLGADKLQGFLFSRPKPLDELFG